MNKARWAAIGLSAVLGGCAAAGGPGAAALQKSGGTGTPGAAAPRAGAVAVAANIGGANTGPGWAMPPEFRPVAARAAKTPTLQVAVFPEIGTVRGTPEQLANLRRPLRERPGVSAAAYRACHSLIERAAKARGAARVEAVSAGPQRRIAGGRIEAPMEFRILYSGRSGFEVRQATIACQLDASSYAPVATPVISSRAP